MSIVRLDEWGMVQLVANGGGGGGGGSMKFYKCASVDTTSHTWTGYLASVDGTTGVWSFASTATTDRPYDRITPSVGKVYDENCTFIVENYKTLIPTEGLVFHAPLDGNTTAATGQVLTPHGTVTPATYEGFACLNLTDGYLSCPVDTLPTGDVDITLSGWGNIPEGALINDYWCMMQYGQSGDWNGSANLMMKRTNYIAAFQCTTTSGGTINPGWHHFAVSRNHSSKEVIFYVDGQLVDVKTTPNSSIAANAGMLIGNAFDGSYWRQWSGYIMAVRVYNRVLDSAGISALAAEFTPAS